MRPLIALLSILITSGGLLAAAISTEDDDAIRQLVKHYVDARNNMDETVLRSLFTQDADQLVSTGQWRRGLDNVLQGAIASSRKETSHNSVTLESLRMLGNDTAIADGRYETSAVGSSAPRKMWSTFVLQRTPDGWRIAAIRNMLPSPALP